MDVEPGAKCELWDMLSKPAAAQHPSVKFLVISRRRRAAIRVRASDPRQIPRSKICALEAIDMRVPPPQPFAHRRVVALTPAASRRPDPKPVFLDLVGVHAKLQVGAVGGLAGNLEARQREHADFLGDNLLAGPQRQLLPRHLAFLVFVGSRTRHSRGSSYRS